jgi:predicted metalloenzyme YecM
MLSLCAAGVGTPWHDLHICMPHDASSELRRWCAWLKSLLRVTSGVTAKGSSHHKHHEEISAESSARSDYPSMRRGISAEP